MTAPASRWSLRRRTASAAEFHHTPIPEPARPEIWVHDITRPALVLGSSQRDDVVDAAKCEQRGVEVVRRRSGGGAVLLTPGEVTWFDVIVPADDSAWTADVHRAMVWLGRQLAALIGDADPRSWTVHEGAHLSTAWSSMICFDGVGAGELTTETGAKLVGISQRRTRNAARLQCCWYSHYDPAQLTGLLLDAPDVAQLRPVATLAPERSAVVLERLVASLR